MKNTLADRSDSPYDFKTRIVNACEANNILCDMDDLADASSLTKIFTLLIERGVSARWLLFHKGFFWYRLKDINYN